MAVAGVKAYWNDYGTTFAIPRPQQPKINDLRQKNLTIRAKSDQNTQDLGKDGLGKGAKVRHVTARPELMRRAREYIEETRADAVRKAQKRNAAYRAPNDLFLGSTTGQPLTKEHVSKHISRLMQKAGIQKASGHRIRASGLTALVLKHDRAGEDGQPFPRDQILLKVADAAGHERWETLEPYLALARIPVHGDEADQNLENIELIRDLRRENARLTAQIEKDKRK